MIHKTRLLPRTDAAPSCGSVCHGLRLTCTTALRSSRALSKGSGAVEGFRGHANDVLLLASSGTGAMEASVSNLTSPGDQVLVLTAANSASAGWNWPKLLARG